ncbi:MAG TPA: hypothetical protein VKY89_19410 [Thermoanaerobaculia bacterium]|jgi:hypothetical protein|nr:hypothetical protein [Thermoanaerobaculia bacterium]
MRYKSVLWLLPLSLTLTSSLAAAPGAQQAQVTEPASAPRAAVPQAAARPGATSLSPFLLRSGASPLGASVEDTSFTFPVTAVGQTSGICTALCFCSDITNCTCDASGTETLVHDLSPPFSAFNYQVEPYAGGQVDCSAGTLVTLPVNLSAGQQLAFNIEFSPTSPGTFTDFLTLAGFTFNLAGSTPNPPAGCQASATVLCIDNQPGDARFQLSIAYHTSQSGGLSGNGQAIALNSVGVNRGGLFWFFAADNPELLVKVLNACTANQKFWVFFSAGTNVGFTLTAVDTQTGAQRTYTNPDINAAVPVQDTAAFDCP